MTRWPRSTGSTTARVSVRIRPPTTETEAQRLNGMRFGVAIAGRTPQASLRIECFLLRRHDRRATGSGLIVINLRMSPTGPRCLDGVIPTVGLVEVGEGTTVTIM